MIVFGFLPLLEFLYALHSLHKKNILRRCVEPDESSLAHTIDFLVQISIDNSLKTSALDLLSEHKLFLIARAERVAYYKWDTTSR